MPPSPPPPGQLPASPPGSVTALCQGRHIAIDRALDQLTAEDGALTTIAVIGGRGLGKSRVVTALGVEAAARGMTVIPLQTGRRYQERFATVLSGLGQLSPLLRTTTIEQPSDLGDPPHLQDRNEASRWHQAVAVLSAMANGRGLLLTIDDAQDMDADSARFLGYVHRAIQPTPRLGPLVAVAMAVPDVELLPAGVFRRLVKSQRTSYLELEPLNQTDLAELVGEIFSDASAPIRRSLTRDLMRRSEGHPSVLEALIPLVDRSTFTIDVGPPPSSPGAVEAVIAEAGRWAIDGAFREAVQKLSTLNGVPGIDLNPATKTLLAESLYRAGAYPEAERITDDLVAAAIAADDHGGALKAATLGLPEAELHEGSAGRAARLLTIDPTRLAGDDDRFKHAVITARQLILVGRADEATAWYEAAAGVTATADHRAAMLNIRWYLTNHRTSPELWLAELESLTADQGLNARLRNLMTEHLAISCYEAGRIGDAADAMETVGSMATEAGDNLRWWHYLCFQNLLAFERGDWTRAEQVRVEAMAHAQACTIADGEHLYLAQRFNEAWVRGEHAVFAPMLHRVPPEIATSWFGRVVRVESLRAAGRLDAEVRADGIALVRQCIDQPQHRALPALAYLSRFVAAEVADPDRQAVLELLGRRAGSLLLHGPGTASFGPVDRYLFHISGDATHLARAIEVADEAAVPLWQVLLRAEYRAVPGLDGELLARQALGLSQGTDLTVLL